MTGPVPAAPVSQQPHLTLDEMQSLDVVLAGGTAFVADRSHGRACTTAAAVLLSSSRALLEGAGVVSCCSVSLSGVSPVNASSCLVFTGRLVVANCDSSAAPLRVVVSMSPVAAGPVMLSLAGAMGVACACLVVIAVAAQLLSGPVRRAVPPKRVAESSLALFSLLCWTLLFVSGSGMIATAVLAGVACCCNAAWLTAVLWRRTRLAGAWKCGEVFVAIAAVEAGQFAGAPVAGLYVACGVVCSVLQLAVASLWLQNKPLWLLGAAAGVAVCGLMVKVNLALWSPLCDPLYRLCTALLADQTLLLLLLAVGAWRSLCSLTVSQT